MKNKHNLVIMNDDENAVLTKLNFEFNQLKGFLLIYNKYKEDWNISEEQIKTLEEEMAEIQLMIYYFCMQIFAKNNIFFSLAQNSIDFELDLKQLFTHKIGEINNAE